MRRSSTVARAVAVAACLAMSVSVVAQAAPHQSDKIRLEARLFSQIVQLDPGDMEGVGPGQLGRQEDNCGAAGEAVGGLFDKDVSCDDPIAPDNENAIAVHPTNPDLILGGSNDYQLNFLGNTVIVHVPSGFFLSQDGGATWMDGEMPLKGSLGGGDPVPAWNLKYELAVFTSLSFVCGQLAPVCSRGNIHFASFDYNRLTGSADDNVTWSAQTIANGNSSDNAAQQIFLDKEWIAVDNNPSSPHYGNMYVTFSQFRSEKGAYDESPIMFVKSENGGRSWTLPVEITGRNPARCTFQDDANDSADTGGPSSSQGTAEGPDDPNACDQDQFSVPVVAPNGDLYVHFQNEQNSAAYELPQRYDSQIMIVKSTDGGDTFSGETPTAANQAGCVRQESAAAGTPSGSLGNPCIVPIHVVDLEDSYDNFSEAGGGSGTAFPDYPQNVSGRNTLTGHQFRVNSAGNIAVGRSPAGSALPYRLWVTFADNCAGVRPGPGVSTGASGGFGGAVTDTNIYYAYSDNGGATWTGGDVNNGCSAGLAGSGRLPAHFDRFAMSDQWFPWSDTDSLGNLHVGFMDADVADGPVRGQYGFSNTTVPLAGGLPSSTHVVSSRPSEPNSSLFFRAGVAGCFDCATFIGDYNGLDVGPDDKVHSMWTDMRRSASSPFPARKVQDAFYASVPPPPAP